MKVLIAFRVWSKCFFVTGLVVVALWIKVFTSFNLTVRLKGRVVFHLGCVDCRTSRYL